MPHLDQPTFEEISEGLSFPYPEIGGEVRPPGFGCLNCVHRTYCPALYWFVRFVQREPDDHNGRNCLEFSDDPADQINTPPNEFDLLENERRNDDGILTEANRNGITDTVTGNAHDN